MPIVLRETERPLYVATFEGDISDLEYEAYLRRCSEAFFADKSPYALVYDGRGFTAMGPKSRQMQSAWINRHRLIIRTYCQAVAFIFESSLQRGVLAAAHLVSSPPYPFKIFAGFDDGYEWCKGELAATGSGTLLNRNSKRVTGGQSSRAGDASAGPQKGSDSSASRASAPTVNLRGRGRFFSDS